MQLAFELPTKYLNTLGQYNDYNFTLAHLATNSAYASYYRSTNKYTICDNSAFELSYPLPAPEIVRAAGILNAQEIIAPDFLNSGTGTIQTTEEFIKYMESSGNLGKYKIMGVVQGANVPDWTNCLMYMNNNKHIDVIGFSYIGCRSFNKDLTNARIAASHLATHNAAGNTTKPIHLLGIGNNPLELTIQKNIPNIRSCDTSLPVVQGYFNDKLNTVSGLAGNKLTRPDDYFDLTLNPKQLEDIVYNIETMKSWVSLVDAK